MPSKKYSLVADISTGDPKGIEPVLAGLAGVKSISETEGGFRVKATLEGESARELNRSLLSALRRVEKKQLSVPNGLTTGLPSGSSIMSPKESEAASGAGDHTCDSGPVMSDRGGTFFLVKFQSRYR